MYVCFICTICTCIVLYIRRLYRRLGSGEPVGDGDEEATSLRARVDSKGAELAELRRQAAEAEGVADFFIVHVETR